MKNKLVVLVIGICLIAILIIINTESSDNVDTKALIVEGDLLISEVIAKNTSLYVDKQGELFDIIEIYNPTSRVIDLTGMGLSDNPEKPHLWTFDNGKIKPGEYLIVYAAGIDETNKLNGYYTNFKLKSEGEKVLLSDDKGEIISIVSYVRLSNDMSMSLIDGKYVYVNEGTPGAANEGLIIEDINQYHQKMKLEPSYASGVYTEAFNLTFETYESYELRYTLDGSEPSNNSSLYEGSIYLDYSNLNKTKYANNQSTFYSVDSIKDEFINKGTVVKARYFNNGIPLGETFVGTYFVWEEASERYSFDIVSLTTDPSNLYDSIFGIYVVGDKFLKEAPSNPDGSTEANYNQRGRDWEREANIEFFNTDGTKYYENAIGIRTFGGWSRANTKKSFKLFARSDYGDKSFEYPFFDNYLDNQGDIIDSFERLLLRTGGNDGEYAMFRDPLADSLVEGMLDYQQYKQVILYLNGEYWGIYHLREHMDENYLASHYNVKSEDVNIIAYNPAGLESYAGDEGELDRFKSLMKFVNDEDISEDDNYDYVKEMLDIDNFIDYYITQMFINNVDWPSNNSKVWRYTGDESKDVINDGRYRYLLYDTEFSFGLYSGADAASHNYFEFLHAETNDVWPNPEWSTSFYRNFMDNDEFREKFLVRFTDLLNSRFDKDIVLGRINEFKDLYEPEMEEYLNRWNFWLVKNVDDWKIKQIYMLTEFTNKRGSNLLNYGKKQYDLEAIRNITIEAFEGGSVVVNNNYQVRFEEEKPETINTHVDGETPLFTVFSDNNKTLRYYSDYAVDLKIDLDEGYEFIMWEIEADGNVLADGSLESQNISINLLDNVIIKAIIKNI